MQKIKIDLENCYGIRALKAELDFSKKKANIIYAPNGSMKSSFSLAFKDLSENKDSKDRIYKDRITKRVITDENNADFANESIFVIESFVPTYESQRISTLLVNKELKDEYDGILSSINGKKENLLKELKKSSGLKNNIEEIISETFTKEKEKFLVALGRVEAEVLDEDESELANVLYDQIFNDKVENFLNTKDFKTKLLEYTAIYDQLISSSTFFKKGVFNHYQASEIAKSLKTHGFFRAEHSIYLNPKTNKKEISKEEELEEIIQQEKEAILTDATLKKSFTELDDKLKANQELRSFREYLLNNQGLIPELSNMELLKEKLWKAYLIKHRDLFKPLMEDYNKGKKRIQEITESASQEATAWQEVINIFNRRFSVPFKVSIENKQDVILRRVTPNIKFQFVDEDCTPVSVERNDLIDVLSNGEKRALYILNIIFEFEARKTAGLKTIFVIDDIADSFDYKNKYAIVEYISDILTEGDFYQIILTHNYDFYRTVWKRLDLGGANYHIVKDSNQVVLEKDTIYKDPFTKWKNNSENPDKSEMLVAMIPFVRNLAEYCGYENEEKKLTSLLHIKSDTGTITFGDLEVVFNKILHGPKTLNLPNHSSLVKTKIYDLAATFCRETEISIELEKKIVLSIAIRLKAEEFLIKKIADSNFVNSLKSHQTGRLIKKYKNLYASDISEREKVQIIERVNLMTPENIHINSFMYEPLLDMSSDHLRDLYKDICAL